MGPFISIISVVGVTKGLISFLLNTEELRKMWSEIILEKVRPGRLFSSKLFIASALRSVLNIEFVGVQANQFALFSTIRLIR